VHLFVDFRPTSRPKFRQGFVFERFDHTYL
jgi:hypothetical protein